ncbi:hypothetical protein [Flavobacterium sp. W20_MBD1_R3]|uniref:hypothetical protein n=1 Tax=Flavobacterium sp. W20_MBD1_R3 TaxID=3240278 RepID=UPI003F8DA3B9
MEYPIIEALKKYKTHFNANQFISLNPNSDFGNLNLVWSQIVIRIECVNMQIVDLYEKFYEQKKRVEMGFYMSNLDDSYLDIMITEQIFYWLRKTADEIISLISICSDYQRTGKYPKKINVSSIGEFIKLKTPFNNTIEKYRNLLQQLNETSNAYKHSFINPQIVAYKGSEYPVVFAYNLHFNDRANQPKFINLDFRVFLNNYNEFLFDVKNHISESYSI